MDIEEVPEVTFGDIQINKVGPIFELVQKRHLKCLQHCAGEGSSPSWTTKLINNCNFTRVIVKQMITNL